MNKRLRKAIMRFFDNFNFAWSLFCTNIATGDEYAPRVDDFAIIAERYFSGELRPH